MLPLLLSLHDSADSCYSSPLLLPPSAATRCSSKNRAEECCVAPHSQEADDRWHSHSLVKLGVCLAVGCAFAGDERVVLLKASRAHEVHARQSPGHNLRLQRLAHLVSMICFCDFLFARDHQRRAGGTQRSRGKSLLGIRADRKCVKSLGVSIKETVATGPVCTAETYRVTSWTRPPRRWVREDRVRAKIRVAPPCTRKAQPLLTLACPVLNTYIHTVSDTR